MCGIVGVFGPQGLGVEREDIKKMLDMIRYRGPDDSGIYLDNHVGIGHVRLSIQDLSPLAAQPMTSHQGNHVLAYNGEIYNVRELQNELRSIGVELRSTGDTEALLEYYVNFGIEKTLRTIKGMFAFIVWDKKNHTITAARDRHGIKPLYYKLGTKNQIFFSSELKVLAHSDYEPDINTLNATLMGLGATWGESTVFKKINHVCAGEWITFSRDGSKRRHEFFRIDDFVDQDFSEQLETYKTREIVDYVHNELKQSIESQLLSDAPVAAFVSGGVDSSLIASIAKLKNPNLRLYHCDVNGASETPAAKELAQKIGLDLRITSVSDQDILDNTAITTYHYEAPLNYHNGACVPFYLLSRQAGKEGIKVVLTGEGSDEYFLGYPNIAIRPYLHALQKAGACFQDIFHKIPRTGDFLWQKKENTPAEQLRNLMFRYELHDRREEAASRLEFIKSKKELDFRVTCIDMVIGNVRTLLQRNDRLGMAGGLESRFPFLDENLAKLAVNLPSKYKIRKILHASDWRHAFLSDKWIVREIANKYMPHSLAFRRKFGFQSSVYRRLQVSPSFYFNGFIQEHYGMNNKAIERMLISAPQHWRENLFSLEIWGMVFPLQKKIEDIQEHIKINTKIVS